MNSNSLFKVSGSTGGTDAHNFPIGFTTYDIDRTSTVEFYGTGAQTIPAIDSGWKP